MSLPTTVLLVEINGRLVKMTVEKWKEGHKRKKPANLKSRLYLGVHGNKIVAH